MKCIAAGISSRVTARATAAQANMTSIVCAARDSEQGVIIEAKPSIGLIAIAEVRSDMFADFSAPLWLEPATLLDAAILEVDTYGEIAVGGGVSHELHLALEDVAERYAMHSGKQDAQRGTATSLAQGVEVDARAPGLGLDLGSTAGVAGNALNTFAPSLDLLVSQLNALPGVKQGAADITVDRLRCGQPTLTG